MVVLASRISPLVLLALVPSFSSPVLAGGYDPWANDEPGPPPRKESKPKPATETPARPDDEAATPAPKPARRAARGGTAELQELGRQHEATVTSVRDVLARRVEVMARLKKLATLARKRGKGKAGARAEEQLERELRSLVTDLPGLRHVTLTTRTGMFIGSEAQLRANIEQAAAALKQRDPRACFEGAELSFRSSVATCAGDLERRCGAFVLQDGALTVRELDGDLEEQTRAVTSAQDFVTSATRILAPKTAPEPADFVFCRAAAEGGATHDTKRVLVPDPAPWTRLVSAADLGAADSKAFQDACLLPRRAAIAKRLKALLRGPDALDGPAQEQLGEWKDAVLLQRDACNEVVLQRCRAVRIDGKKLILGFVSSSGCNVREATEQDLEKEMSMLKLGGLDAGDTGKRLETISVCRALREASFKWEYEAPRPGAGCGPTESKSGGEEVVTP